MLRLCAGFISFCAIVFFASLVCADHSHEYEQASKAYAEGDYKTAFHIWGEEAEKERLACK